MLDLSLVTPFTKNAVDTIKIAVLYFDKISIQEQTIVEVEPDNPEEPMRKGSIGTVRAVIPFIKEDFINDIKYALDEGIVEINEERDKSYLDNDLEDSLYRIFYNNLSLLIKEKEIEYDEKGRKISSMIAFADNEAKIVHEQYIGQLKKGLKIDLGFIYRYYEFLFIEAASEMLSGKSVLTASSALLKFIEYSYTENFINLKRIKENIEHIIDPKIVLDALSTQFIDLSDIPLEDILEARLKLYNELEAFRAEMLHTQFLLKHEYSVDEIIKHGSIIAKEQIAKKIDDLEKSIKLKDVKAVKKIAEILKDPKKYVPLATSALIGMPLWVALLISFGFISSEIGLELYQNSIEHPQNAFIYLLKLKKKLKNSK